jgi:hypothetical protein
VVNAQAKAALTTLNFMQTMGLDKNNKTISSQFTYLSANATTVVVQPRTLRVPLLTLIPIPFLTVRHSDVHDDTFNALWHTVVVVCESCAVSRDYAGV